MGCDCGAFRSASSGRDHPTIREGLSSQEASSGQEVGRPGECLAAGQAQVSWRLLMDLSCKTAQGLNVKIDMRRYFPPKNMAVHNSIASATSDSNIIKLKTEIQKE